MNRKALLVEDVPLNARIVQNLLERHGITDITLAADGVSAVDLFCGAIDQGLSYDLVLLDIMMPNMCGNEALQLMREKEKQSAVAKTTIIMITMLDSPRDMIDAIISGDCTDYIVKPVDFEVLGSKLKDHGVIA